MLRQPLDLVELPAASLGLTEALYSRTMAGNRSHSAAATGREAERGRAEAQGGDPSSSGTAEAKQMSEYVHLDGLRQAGEPIPEPTAVGAT